MGASRSSTGKGSAPGKRRATIFISATSSSRPPVRGRPPTCGQAVRLRWIHYVRERSNGRYWFGVYERLAYAGLLAAWRDREMKSQSRRSDCFAIPTVAQPERQSGCRYLSDPDGGFAAAVSHCMDVGPPRTGEHPQAP